MADVLGGVVLLRARERPAGPVAALHVLGELHAEVAIEERLEAELEAPAEARRGVRIEDRGEVEGVLALEERDVVLGGVQDLLDRGVREERPERGEVAEGERVDQADGPARVGDLEEADLLVIVVEAVGLGVDRERGGAFERAGEVAQLVGRADPADGGVDESRIGRVAAGVKVV